MRSRSAPPFKRAERVADEIVRTLASAIIEEVADDRVRRCTVTGVSVSDDLRHAKVFFSTLETEPVRIRETQKALQRAEGFFKRILGEALRLRYTPSLSFVRDTSLERGAKMLALINEVMSTHENDGRDDTDD